MKILYLNAVGTIGGAERLLLDLMASFRQADPGAELHLVAGTDGPLVAKAERRGVRVTVLPLSPTLAAMGDSALRGRGRWQALLSLAWRGAATGLAAVHYAGQLRRLVRQVRPQVVHSNSLKFHLLTRLAGLREPVVWHLHDFLSLRPLMARVLARVAGRAAGALAVSRAVAEDAQAILPAVPLAVVTNAVDTEHFAPGPGDGSRLDELAGLPPAPPGTVRVGLVATFARWKGHDVFLQAAGLLARELPRPAARFYVIGGPIYQTRGSQWSTGELREQAAGLVAAGLVGFVGFQEDPAAVYRALDVVVHASTQPEPFGLTIAEAMACGRPVLVAQAGGAAELFTPGHDAVGVPPADARALASAVGELIRDPRERQRLGENARSTAVRRFSRDRLGPEVLAAYAGFLEASRGRASAPATG